MVMNKMMVAATSLALLVSANAHADKFDDAADKLCSKLTMCLTKQLENETGLPGVMKGFSKKIAKTACDALQDSRSFLDEKGLIEAGTACYNSAAIKSCDAIVDGLNTPECEEFEKLSKEKSN